MKTKKISAILGLLSMILLFSNTAFAVPLCCTYGNSASSAVVASVVAAGTTQATATVVTTSTVVITTVVSGAGIELLGISQPQQLILNRGTNTLLVYPPSGGQIESLGANSAYSIAAGAQALIISTSATQAYVSGSSFQ